MKYLNFKKEVSEGTKVYIVIKEIEPIVLSDIKNIIFTPSKPVWRVRELTIDYIDFNSGKCYNEEDFLIDDDIVKFLTYEEAQRYCDEKNKNG